MGLKMLDRKNKLAFTLAEVMIVLLVLTVLFAACAPLITKRKKSNKVEIWQWSSRDSFRGPMDSFYNSSADNRGTVFFGLTPENEDDINDIYAPYAKVIIRSGPVSSNSTIQRQMQFRFRRTSLTDPGEFAGTVLMDTKNVLMGGEYESLMNVDKDNNTYPRRNVGIGYQALTSLQNAPDESSVAEGNTALGYMALSNTRLGKNNVAIGSQAGRTNTSGRNNVYLGSMAGYSATGSDNVYIGYASNGGTGNFNTYIGAYSGNLFGNSDDTNRKSYTDTSDEYITNSDVAWGASHSGSFNTAIGYRALNNVTTGVYNTAIGVNALENLVEGRYNTAIGYGACSNVTNGSYKTCIGYNSGPAANDSSNSDVIYALGIIADDGVKYTDSGDISSSPGVQRTYIGSKPKNFGGDAVLEIHNSSYNNSKLINNPEIKNNTTTIINGNLLVKGRLYLTIGSYLYPFYRSNTDIYPNNNYYVLGADVTKPCSYNQWSYYYNNTYSKCSDLSDVFYPVNTGTLSDRRLKELGTKNSDGLNKIEQLKVYNYIFKSDKNKLPQVGVIAQDLQKIFPYSISKDENGYLKIRWDEMFYAAINAIKELDSKITSLIKESLNLEHKIDKLEKENIELEKEIILISEKINKLKDKK